MQLVHIVWYLKTISKWCKSLTALAIVNKGSKAQQGVLNRSCFFDLYPFLIIYKLFLLSQGIFLLQAASYDFDMPLMVNGVRWSAASLSGFSTAASSSILTSLSAGSRKHVIKPLSVTMATPQSQRIQATGGGH